MGQQHSVVGCSSLGQRCWVTNVLMAESGAGVNRPPLPGVQDRWCGYHADAFQQIEGYMSVPGHPDVKKGPAHRYALDT